MYRKLYSLIALLTMFSLPSMAQELNCKVKVMHEKIQGVDPQVFRTLERSITEFINTRKWTTEEFLPTEKIDCNILINLTGRMGGNEDGFNATLNIQSARPVYNSSYTSPMINFIDRDFAFQFSQYSQLQFDDNRITGTNAFESNLTAVLAFYAYVMIGLDYDSYSPNGGVNYFKRAQNIVNNAPEQGKSILGWKAHEDKKNRYWITDQLLSPRFAGFHNFWYNMHREGFDNMYNKPAESRQKILAGLSVLQQMQKDNPGAILIQFLFNAKADEFLRILSQLPKEERTPYIAMLAQTDVTNSAKYQSLK